LHSSGITVKKKVTSCGNLLAALGRQLGMPQALQRTLLEESGHYLDCSMFFNLARQCPVLAPFIKKEKIWMSKEEKCNLHPLFHY